MIVKFRIVRKDTKAPVQGAKIVLEHGESDGITNSAGEAEIVTYYSGSLMYSVVAAGYNKVAGTVQVPSSGGILFFVELGAYVVPPSPPQPGEEDRGGVGSSCRLIAFWSGGREWCKVRHVNGQDITSGFALCSAAFQAGIADPRCHEAPAPAPRSIEDVQKDVDILRGTLQGFGARLSDLISGLYAWLVDHVLDAVWTALTRDRKEGQ